MVSKRHDWHLVDIFLDFRSGDSISGREEFQRMLEACRAKKLDIILTKSISRFGRNTEEMISALREIKNCGVRVIFDEEKVDTLNTDSELMVSIISAYAQAENESRSRNQKWAIQKRLRDGTSEIYARACYGYRKGENGELVIDPAEAKVVQEIFQLYCDGASILGIQRELEKNGVKSPSGNDRWSKRTIDELLRNDKYIGDATVYKTYSVSTPAPKRVINSDGSHEKYVAKNSHPAIISHEMFDAVQLERNRRSNVLRDENGIHRKSTKYSSKKPIEAKSDSTSL